MQPVKFYKTMNPDFADASACEWAYFTTGDNCPDVGDTDDDGNLTTPCDGHNPSNGINCDISGCGYLPSTIDDFIATYCAA